VQDLACLLARTVVEARPNSRALWRRCLFRVNKGIPAPARSGKTPVTGNVLRIYLSDNDGTTFVVVQALSRSWTPPTSMSFASSMLSKRGEFRFFNSLMSLRKCIQQCIAFELVDGRRRSVNR